MMEMVICKQPIFNRTDELINYELFYRYKNSQEVTIDENEATIELLVNTFLSFNAEKITHLKRFFVKFPQTLILNDFLDTFEHDQLIIELGDDFIITEQSVARIEELKSYGFQFAMSSALLKRGQALTSRLLKQIDICTVDFEQCDDELHLLVDELIMQHNTHISLLIRNVHQRPQFEFLKRKGFTLFQGDYFTEPETVTTKEIPSIVTNYFELLSLLNDDMPDITEIAELIEMDVSLSYKILKLATTQNNQLKLTITSIRQAIMIIGLLDLQKWIYLLAMRANKRKQSDMERELLRASLLRAKVCEQLARFKRYPNYTEYFLTGLFSNIDSLLGKPMDVIMEQLPFSPGVKQTLTTGDTEIAPFLQLAIDLDKLQFDKIYAGSIAVQIPLEQVELVFANAQSWVDDIFASMESISDQYSY